MKKNKQLKLKKRANSGDIEAIYEYGMLLYHETTDYVGALKYLLKAASNNYELAFGDIATILYREKNDVDGAEKWFEKAKKANCLLAPAAYEYGMLLINERGDNELGSWYLKKASGEDY
jgi:TPR repeat protein